MNRISRLWAALVTGFLAAFVIPAAAWAAENDLIAKRPKFGFGGILGLLCCLVVVGVIGVVVFLIIQNQKKKR